MQLPHPGMCARVITPYNAHPGMCAHVITPYNAHPRSTSHPDVPDTDKCVRVRDYFSRMVIRSPSRVDELGLDFELTYFDNPQTNLPSSCVNWVASTGKFFLFRGLLTWDY